MRRLLFACVPLVALSLVDCSSPPLGDGPVGTSRSPIAYGTVDTTHTAVVAVLAPVPSDAGLGIEECSGTIVRVSGSIGYVLTAAHCCNTYTPTVVVASNDYSVGEQYVFSGTPVAPAYAVVSGSVSYDPMFGTVSGQLVHDFCMLKFSGATASTPTIALPTSANDGVGVGVQVEHVGFGITEDGGPNQQRRAGTDTVDAPLSSLVLQYAQGGDADVPGTCSGDSGGPALLPPTSSQAQQVVVGVTSYGTSGVCADNTSGGASRVSSAIGEGAFITSYLPAPAPPPVPAANRLEMAALALGLLMIGIRVAPRRTDAHAA